MNIEEKRLYKAKKQREYHAKKSPIEKQRKSKAALNRYYSLSPQDHARKLALERLTWNRRKRNQARMSPEQRQREIDRWASLGPEQRKAEKAFEVELYIRDSYAIDDLGTDNPDYTLSLTWSYSRDKRVRGAVLRRAKGRCEYCGKPGFMMGTGKRYLETHHVIALADEGVDRLTNVIALCANDHREAHFGERRIEIESEMIVKLKDITNR